MNKKYLEIRKENKTITFYNYAPKNEIDVEIETDWTDQILSIQLNKDEIQQLIDFLQGQLTTNDKNKL